MNSCSILRKNNFCGVLMLTWKWTVAFTTSSGVKCRRGDILKDEIGLSAYYLKTSGTGPIQNNVSVGNDRPTVFDQHKYWSTQFQESDVPEPDLSSKYIIEYTLKFQKPYEFDLNMKREVTEEEENKIKKLCECRLARMPVQYIIKEWDFRDLRLFMSPPVFIPRPETEQLVELVLERATPHSVLVEIGCGSGAICLSLIKAVPQARVIAVDQSKLACELTKKNAELYKVADNLQVVHSKLQDDGNLSQPLNLDCSVDIIVSNPPYVPYAQLLDLQPEIKLYEDLRALEAGRDGLRVIRSLLTFASSTLRPGGLMFLEVDSSHPPLIQEWISSNPGLNVQFVGSYKDFCDKERFVEVKKL